MRALVTGAAGFIGSHLCDRLLAAGYEVTAVDCFTPHYDVSAKVDNVADARRSPACTLVQADLRTDPLEPLVDGVDVVFHQAAKAGVRASWDDGFADYATHNVLATQRLLEATRRVEVGRFVYASSSSIYGNALSYPTLEDVTPMPFSPYGVTKLAGEHLCRAYAQNFRVPTLILRYFTVYGPRQRPDMGIYRLIEAARNGTAFPLFGDGAQVRELTFVDDIVDANLRAATSEVELGEVFNIAGGSEIKMSDLIELVAATAGGPIAVEPATAPGGDVRRNAGSTVRARERLGWSAHVDLAEGVRRQVEWHRAR